MFWLRFQEVTFFSHCQLTIYQIPKSVAKETIEFLIDHVYRCQVPSRDSPVLSPIPPEECWLTDVCQCAQIYMGPGDSNTSSHWAVSPNPSINKLQKMANKTCNNCFWRKLGAVCSEHGKAQRPEWTSVIGDYYSTMYMLGQAPETPTESSWSSLCLGSSSYPLSVTEHVSPGNLPGVEVESLSSSLLLSTLYPNPCQAHSMSQEIFLKTNL